MDTQAHIAKRMIENEVKEVSEYTPSPRCGVACLISVSLSFHSCIFFFSNCDTNLYMVENGVTAIIAIS